MNARERAKQLMEYPHPDLLVYEIERAIIAAITEEREACAMIADEMKAEMAQRPDKLQYGRTQIEAAEYIAAEIRARSES